MNRFDNLSTDQLLAMEIEAFNEAATIRAEVIGRLKAEASKRVRVGAIHPIVAGRFKGRRMWVTHIHVDLDPYFRRRYGERRAEPSEAWVVVEGRLNSKSSPSREGWTVRHQQTRLENLGDPTP